MHKAKIVHRDMKADNVIFDSNGYPKLIDFSVAFSSAEGSSCRLERRF